MRDPSPRGVLFDVGYTLLDETPRLDVAFRWVASYLGAHGVPVTPERLRGLYEAACLAPRHTSLLVQTVKDAGASDDLARAMRRALPWEGTPMPAYPGAATALRRLRAAGFRTGVLANQPVSARDDLERAGLAPLLDDVWLSEGVGLVKPDPAFFRLALDRWGLPADRVVYVGDRPDNDVAPARALGMHTVRVLLGPHARQPERSPAERAHHVARTLEDAAEHLLGRG